METFKRSHCFLCLSEDSEEALVRKEEVVKALETSCQYLIDKDEVRKGVLQLFEDDKGKTEGLEVVLCGSCGEVAESVQELHLELEEIRRRLLGRVKVLQGIVVRNSRLFGTNGRAKKSLEELEEWVEAQEKLGMRRLETEKRFLKLLHDFQTLVFEKDFEVRDPTPAVTFESEDALSRETGRMEEKDEIKVEVREDDIPSEESFDFNEAPEDNDGLEYLPSSSESSEDDDNTTVRSNETRKITVSNLRMTSRRGRRISNSSSSSSSNETPVNTDKSSGNTDPLTKAQLLAAELQKFRRYQPKKYKRLQCVQENCSVSISGRLRFERHLREEHETSAKHFTCPDCRHEFTTKDLFQIHLVYYCGLLTVNCHLCSVAMAPKDMKDHLESTHNLESLHHCQFCNLCFGHYVGLVDHLASHGMISFSCVECGNEDSTFTHPEYVQHLFQAHGNGDARTSSVVYPCDFPNCTSFCLRSEDLIRHKRTHFNCTHCNAECRTKKLLEGHLRKNHKIGVKPFSCDACDKTFLMQGTLERHKLKEHVLGQKVKCDLCPKEYASKSGLKVHKIQAHGIGVSKTYECEHCNKVFSSSAFLWKHRVSHSKEKGHICDTCGYTTNYVQVFKDHLKTHEGVLNYFCSHCPKAFCTQRQLQNHLRYHSDPGDKLECDLCDFVGINRYAIYSHKKTVHGPPTMLPPDSDASNVRFECSTCHAKFTTKMSYFKHLAGEHGEKPYVCKICEATFPYKTTLQVHHRKHRKVKHGAPRIEGPFPCSHCSNTYRSQSGLWNHLQGLSKEKNFVCDKCPTAFNTKLKLFLHKKGKHYEGSETGKKLKCETCGLESIHLLSYRQHLKSHGEAAKTFKCDKCPKKFTNRSLLQQHSDGHSNVKSQRCDACKKSFRYVSSLWRHKRKKHNISN